MTQCQAADGARGPCAGWPLLQGAVVGLLLAEHYGSRFGYENRFGYKHLTVRINNLYRDKTLFGSANFNGFFL
jgi:hypothetical protein